MRKSIKPSDHGKSCSTRESRIDPPLNHPASYSGERVSETRARFFDGWVLVGILFIQVNAKGPVRRSSGPRLVEASPCCPSRRGEAFYLLLANDSPLRFVNGLAALDKKLLLEWVKSLLSKSF